VTLRDFPQHYGPWQACYDRFVRRRRDGTWLCLPQALQVDASARSDIDREGEVQDATHVKGHRGASSARHQMPQSKKVALDRRVAVTLARRARFQITCVVTGVIAR
jgi:transposase